MFWDLYSVRKMENKLLLQMWIHATFRSKRIEEGRIALLKLILQQFFMYNVLSS